MRICEERIVGRNLSEILVAAANGDDLTDEEAAFLAIWEIITHADP